jgi:hypothetical protein
MARRCAVRVAGKKTLVHMVSAWASVNNLVLDLPHRLPRRSRPVGHAQRPEDLHLQTVEHAAMLSASAKSTAGTTGAKPPLRSLRASLFDQG